MAVKIKAKKKTKGFFEYIYIQWTGSESAAIDGNRFSTGDYIKFSVPYSTPLLESISLLLTIVPSTSSWRLIRLWQYRSRGRGRDNMYWNVPVGGSDVE